MAQQLRISEEFYATVKAEADAMHRRPGGQIEHWAKLGRLLEKTVTYQRVQAFLAGTLSLDALSGVEHALAMESIVDEVDAFSRSGGMREYLAREEAGAGDDEP